MLKATCTFCSLLAVNLQIINGSTCSTCGLEVGILYMYMYWNQVPQRISTMYMYVEFSCKDLILKGFKKQRENAVSCLCNVKNLECVQTKLYMYTNCLPHLQTNRLSYFKDQCNLDMYIQQKYQKFCPQSQILAACCLDKLCNNMLWQLHVYIYMYLRTGHGFTF